jgi:mono/diheme cytochrome c family protein
MSAARAGAAVLILIGAGALGVRADDSAFNAVAAVKDVGGEDIYRHICQGCHMPQGEGAIGAGHYPKLAGDPALASWQYAALMVLNGRDNMPAFGAASDLVWDGPTVHLSDAQVADVVNYVRSHFGNRFKDHTTEAEVAKLPHSGQAPASK